MGGEVEEVRANKAKQAADIKAAKKQAKEAARAIAAAKKTDAKTATAKKATATAKKAPDGAKPLHESSAGESNTNKRKAEEEPDEEVS